MERNDRNNSCAHSVDAPVYGKCMILSQCASFIVGRSFLTMWNLIVETSFYSNWTDSNFDRDCISSKIFVGYISFVAAK
jgi:hypothetical protein